MISEGVKFGRPFGPGHGGRFAAEVLADGVAREVELAGNLMNGLPLGGQVVYGIHCPTPKHGSLSCRQATRG